MQILIDYEKVYIYVFLPANVIIDIILRRIYTYRLKGAGTGHFCGIAYQWQ